MHFVDVPSTLRTLHSYNSFVLVLASSHQPRYLIRAFIISQAHTNSHPYIPIKVLLSSAQDEQASVVFTVHFATNNSADRCRQDRMVENSERSVTFLAPQT